MLSTVTFVPLVYVFPPIGFPLRVRLLATTFNVAPGFVTVGVVTAVKTGFGIVEIWLLLRLMFVPAVYVGPSAVPEYPNWFVDDVPTPKME